MKKIWIALISLLLALSLAGCKKENLIDWLKSGTYSYEFTASVHTEGAETSIAGEANAKNGEYLVDFTANTIGIEISMKILMSDEGLFMISDSTQAVLKLPQEAVPDEVFYAIGDYSALKKVKSGKGEVDGRSLPYEGYSLNGADVRFYMDGSDVFAIETASEGETFVLLIKNASGKVSDSLFDIPSGYDFTEMTL